MDLPATKILVIDTDSASKEFITSALQFENYDVQTVSTTGEAESLLEIAAVDLVIFDVGTLSNGERAFIRSLRQARGNGVGLIVSTANPSKETVLALREFELLDFLIKPYDRERLLKAVSKLNSSAAQTAPEVEERDELPDFSNLTAVSISEDREISTLLHNALHELKVRNYEAGDWIGGIKLLQQQKPQVVFLSSTLRDVDGATIVKRLSESGDSEKMMFVLVHKKNASGRYPPEVDFVVDKEELNTQRVAMMLNQATVM